MYRSYIGRKHPGPEGPMHIVTVYVANRVRYDAHNAHIILCLSAGGIRYKHLSHKHHGSGK